jgi:hypothetical protein
MIISLIAHLIANPSLIHKMLSMDFHKFQLGLLGASVHCRHNIISHENQEISILTMKKARTRQKFFFKARL